MKSFAGIYLLYLFISLPVSTAPVAQKQYQSIIQLSLIEIPTISFKSRRQSPCFAIQTKSSRYTFSLAELFTYQFLLLAFAMNLFYLNTDK